MKRIISFVSPVIFLALVFSFLVAFKQDETLSSHEKNEIQQMLNVEEIQSSKQNTV